MENSTFDVVIEFVEENIELVKPPRRIVSDKATAFMAASVQEFMEKHGIDLNAVVPDVPMANGRSETSHRKVRGTKCMRLGGGYAENLVRLSPTR